MTDQEHERRNLDYDNKRSAPARRDSRYGTNHDRNRDQNRRRDYDRRRDEDQQREYTQIDDRRRDDSDDYNSRKRRRHRSDQHGSHPTRRSRSPNPRSPPSRRRSLSSSRRTKHAHPSSSTHAHKRRNLSRSPSPPSRPNKASPPPPSKPRSTAPLPSQNEAFTGKLSTPSTALAPPTVEKVKPNFSTSGLLAAETNTVAGTTIVLKYNEPPEARLPPASHAWRLYTFKDSAVVHTLELGSRSCWLFGRERSVVDVLIEHPSCSKQHAVLQFRHVLKKDEYGEGKGAVRLYVIDLESANGTRLNGEGVPEGRFVECRSGDVLGFGDSTREYVLMLPPKE